MSFAHLALIYLIHEAASLLSGHDAPLLTAILSGVAIAVVGLLLVALVVRGVRWLAA